MLTFLPFSQIDLTKPGGVFWAIGQKMSDCPTIIVLLTRWDGVLLQDVVVALVK